MTRELALTIIVAVTVGLVGLGVWAWRRRTRRDADIVAPTGDLPPGTEPLTVHSGFYVATTAHDQPLERLAIRGLGFRSRAEITVAAAGVVLDLPGQPRFFLPVERLVAADRATVAIDRVVERDGLTRVVWRAQSVGDGDVVVDTYLRLQDAPAHALADAVAGIIDTPHPTTPTGSDA